MWRKYWKLVVIAVLIVAGIGTYYVQNHQLSDQTFTFEKTEGDAKEVEPIVLEGTMYYSMMNSEAFKVTAKHGTTYFQDESFLKRLEGYYNSSRYEQRKEKYRNFMRGKAEPETSFDENDAYLAYAEINDGWIQVSPEEADIDVLDKESNERHTFQIPLENIGNSPYAEIMAVAINGDQLSLVVESDDQAGTKITEYVVNIAQEKLINTNEVTTFGDDDLDSFLFSYNVRDETQPDKLMIAIEKTTYNEIGNGEVEEETHIETLWTHDMSTGESKKNDVPENVGTLIGSDAEALYFQTLNDDVLTVSKYNRDAKEVEKEATLEVESTMDPDRDIEVQHDMQDGKIYITTFYYGVDAALPIMVIDANSMDVLYKGKVMSKSMKKGTEDEVDFDNMEVMEE